MENFRKQLSILEKNRITLGFDCGMPLCVFSNEDLGRLFKLNRGRVKFSCAPAIDIGPDMQTWACFHLANYEKRSLYDFDNVSEINKYFSTQAEQIRQNRKGIFEECDRCVHFEEKLCGGGCLAHLLKD